MHEIISNSLQTAATDTIPTSKAKIESEPWVTDEYISARLQAYNCKDPANKKSSIKQLRALQSKLMNRYYQKRGKEISEGFEAREAERYFRQAKDLQGPLKHTVQKPLCTELEFVQHFSSHFKDRQLPLPPELNRAEPFLPPTLAAAPEIDDSPPSLEEIRTIVEIFKLRKAAGSDDLVNELLRYSNDCPDFIQILHELVTVI